MHTAQLYSLAETPQLPPSPRSFFGLIYEGAIGQQARRHDFKIGKDGLIFQGCN